MIDLKKYMVTTALAKANKDEARTFQAGEDLTLASEFLRTENGMIRQWAPTTGAATESVDRTRAEIVGTAFYAKDSEENVSEYTWYAGKVNYKGEFVFQQMHCKDGNDPTFKAFGRITNAKTMTGQILYGIRKTASSSDPKKVVLIDGIQFGQPINSVISLEPDGTFKFTVTQADRVATFTVKLDEKRAARPHVFHWGPYNQVDMGAKEEPAGDGTLIWSQNIEERHGPVAVEPPVVVDPPVVTPPVVTPPVVEEPADLADEIKGRLSEMEDVIDNLPEAQAKELRVLIKEVRGLLN